MSMSIYKNTIKGVEYEIREYNWGRNEYDLIVDGSMKLDSKCKDECFMKILEMAGDDNDNGKK